MSMPTWPGPDPKSSNPFAAPTESDHETPGRAPAPGAPGAPPTGPAAPSDAPVPYVSDRPTDPAPYGGQPNPGQQYGAPPAYGYPQAPPAPPAYGYPQAAPAYGYPQQAAPAYGPPQPAYGYGAPQPAYGYGQPVWAPAQPPMSGLAIAALVASCAGVVTIGASGMVGLGLGIGALRGIRRTGARGRGLAIAGIAVGAFMTLCFAGYVALMVWGISGGFDDSSNDTWNSGTSWNSQGDTGTSTSDTTLPDYSLVSGFTPGQCLAESPYTYDMTDASIVDCAQPHAAEIISIVELTSAPNLDTEGSDPAVEAAWTTCGTAMDDLTSDVAGVDLWIDVFYPHPDQWRAGETSGYCVVSSDTPTLVGSAVGHTLASAGTQS